MQAGPSSQLIEDLVSIPKEEETPRASISGSQDLLKTFGLLDVYSDFVKPYISTTADIKGKSTVQKERKKVEKGYYHLVADLPGRYGNPKDTYMRDLAFYPDYQPVEILPFDDQTLRDSFTLQPGITDNVDDLLGLTAKPPKMKKTAKKRPRDGMGASINSVAGVANSMEASTNGTPNANGESDGGEPSKKKKRKL